MSIFWDVKLHHDEFEVRSTLTIIMNQYHYVEGLTGEDMLNSYLVFGNDAFAEGSKDGRETFLIKVTPSRGRKISKK